MSPQQAALLSALAVLVAAILATPGHRVRRPALESTAAARASRPGPVGRLGGVLRRRWGSDPDPSRDRQVGWLTLVCLLTLLVSPALTMLIVAAAAAVSVVRRRRHSRRQERELVDELPDVVDLLSLAVSSGHTVPLAVGVVAEHGRGQLAYELDRARRAATVGSGLADELDQIPNRLGDPARPLVRALSEALRDGAPLAPALEQVAAEVRTIRRRAAEERARRVSVRLLFPLVCCTLPAFALLTVVPLLISTLRGMSL